MILFQLSTYNLAFLKQPGVIKVSQFVWAMKELESTRRVLNYFELSFFKMTLSYSKEKTLIEFQPVFGHFSSLIKSETLFCRNIRDFSLKIQLDEFLRRPDSASLQ